MLKSENDTKLGMGCPIHRRDFLNGVAMTLGASLFPFEGLLGQDSGPDSSARGYFLSKGITQQDRRYDPPALMGMRGSHPGSFEAAHALRDGNGPRDALDTGEHYDLMVVGGGISGLASAYFYRKSVGLDAKILILDNHDDFGGHAKRNETVLDFPVSIGDYRFPSSPEEPCVLHLLRTPCKPGSSAKEQVRAGRYELMVTPFETFERKVREQLGRMLAGGGFDSAQDIQAITVNRWPHGYAYEYNSLFEPQDRPASEGPCVQGRKPFGRITIANSDSDGHAYTNIAIDQGYRAVQEVLAITKAAAKGA